MSEMLVLTAVKSTAESVNGLMGYASDLARIVRDCGGAARNGLDLELIEAAAQCRSLMIAILDRIECENPCDSMGNASRIMMPRHLVDLGLDQLYARPVDPETLDQTSSMSDMYRAASRSSNPAPQSSGPPLAGPGNIQLLVTAGSGLEVLS